VSGIVSVAHHEDGMRSSPDSLATTAAVEGDDVVVDGTKLFVPNANVADDLVVVARDPAATGAGAVRLVVVPTNAPGVCRSRLMTFAHDAQHEVSFEAVRVPVDRVLARVSSGAWSAVEEARRVATALRCVEMVGGAQLPGRAAPRCRPLDPHRRCPPGGVAGRVAVLGGRRRGRRQRWCGSPGGDRQGGRR
jgi:alkylation response protein AidB-like acyl-CoA dehydrogenase